MATPAPAVATHCPYCALNCGLGLDVEDGRIAGLTTWKGSPLTGGALCAKGRVAHEQVHHGDRVRRPLVREGGDFVEVGWDEALARVAGGFGRIRDESGPAANAVLSGGSLTNEKVYLVGKLARLGFRTPHIDYNGRFCMTSAGVANREAFGRDRMMSPLEELRRTDVAVVVGANVSAAFPVVIPQLLAGVRGRGGRVVVIDPRSSRFVQPEDLHVPLRPGTDGALFAGLLRALDRRGLVDREFIADRTVGFDAAIDAAQDFDPARTCAITDVDPEIFEELVTLLGTTDRAMYLHGRGPEQQLTGTRNVSALINVGLARGHVGRPGCGIDMLTGQRNGQGGREWGQRCDQLPAGRSIADPEHRAVVARHWGVDAEDLPGPGATYVEILEKAGRGEIRGLFSICTNMSVSAPDLAAVDRQLAALDFFVAVDPFFSRSCDHADVVLPGATFAEESGTITTLEGRVIRIDQAVAPESGRSEISVLSAVAAGLGASGRFDYDTPEEVFEEMRLVSSGGPVDYAGITYARLREHDGVFWPCPTDDHPGTPQLYTERFAHVDGRARFVPTSPVPPPVDTDRPYVLTTGRVLSEYLSGNQTMRLRRRGPDGPFVEIHPSTALGLGLDVDDAIELATVTGTSVVPWVANADLRPDTVFMPYHWPACNRLIASDLDPHSRIPGFKFAAVALRVASDGFTPSKHAGHEPVAARP
ncbi:MAG: molybdopterin oxidoreductase family protein [Actinomycetota bacterium]